MARIITTHAALLKVGDRMADGRVIARVTIAYGIVRVTFTNGSVREYIEDEARVKIQI